MDIFQRSKWENLNKIHVFYLSANEIMKKLGMDRRLWSDQEDLQHPLISPASQALTTSGFHYLHCQHILCLNKMVDMLCALASDPVLIMRLKKANPGVQSKRHHIMSPPNEPKKKTPPQSTEMDILNTRPHKRTPYVPHPYMATVMWLTLKIMLFFNHILAKNIFLVPCSLHYRLVWWWQLLQIHGWSFIKLLERWLGEIICPVENKGADVP